MRILSEWDQPNITTGAPSGRQSTSSASGTGRANGRERRRFGGPSKPSKSIERAGSFSTPPFPWIPPFPLFPVLLEASNASTGRLERPVRDRPTFEARGVAWKAPPPFPLFSRRVDGAECRRLIVRSSEHHCFRCLVRDWG